MKRRFLGIVLCTAALLAAGCSSNTDASMTAAGSNSSASAGMAADTSADTTKDTAAAKLETGEETGNSSAVKADPVEKKKVYVSPDWVQSVLDGNQEESKDYMVLECAWGTVQDAASYKDGHIVGAYHMNTDDIESEEYWNIRTPEEIKALMAEYGITKDTTVICYSDKGTNSADDRVAFTLLWAGVENVKCLDGGFEAWLESGYETEKTINTPQAADKEFGVEIPAHPEYILSIDQVKEKLADDDNFKLVSIRSRDEFLGKTSGYGYIDRAGEPEGAVWGHDTDDGSYLNENGTTAGLDVLKGYLEESGASLDNELSFYCGTGWRATIPFLICYENGMANMTLYDGGWYQWQMDDSLPVQVGDPANSDCRFTTVGELSTDKAKK